jgi:penicillin-binding protein 1A
LAAGNQFLHRFDGLKRGRASFAAAFGCAVIFFMISRAFSVSCDTGADCVTLRELRDGVPLPEALRVYDRHGVLLAEVAGPLRDALRPEEIPELLAQAFVAVEDRRFRDHRGVDALGVVRAALRNIRAGGIAEGASTIPMQLVRTLWAESLRDVGPWRRKVIEARTAPRLIRDLGHDRVLSLYLNSIYMGNGVYGVERASHHYFGAGVETLDLGQIATLVGITRGPEYYEPRRHPDRAQARRDVVLGVLAEAGLVSAEEAENASSVGLGIAPLDAEQLSRRRRSHLTAAVTRRLRSVAPDLAGRAGLHLHTTIDAGAQGEGEAALQIQIESIEAGRYGKFDTPDSLARLERAAVALDPSTGAVLAWVGGRDFTRSEFDRVDQARRQVGSLVKPFLVAAALEQGYGMLDLVSSDTTPILTESGPWLPADHVQETSLPLREALIRSSNRAAAHLTVNLGLETAAQFGERVGLTGPIPALPSSAVGAFEVSLLEMTSAYAVFGNGGFRVEPHLLDQIEAPDGTVLWSRADTLGPTRVLDDGVAFAVLDAMRAVIDRGTGYMVRSEGYRGPAAGKTGTTNEGRDAWFIGLTPEVVAGVWIGFDQPRPIVAGAGGGALAAPAWASWMRSLEAAPLPTGRPWIPPTGIERVKYDPETGDVLGLECRGTLGWDYEEAWVRAGRYQLRDCRGGVLGWLERLWNAVIP